MKKYLLIFILLIILPITGCCKNNTNISPDYNELIITLERTACLGECPIYTLTIHGDGTVVYEGKDFVKTKGRKESIISKEKIEELILEFNRADYFSLKDNYVEHTMTDAHSVITSITINGKLKIIEHYHGDFSAPEALSTLENKIDEIVNSDQWVK
jgi:hypothetical protein